MKTALNQLKERVEFIKLFYENELTLNYESHVKQILEGKLSVTDNILKEIDQLLPTDESQTEALKKEIEELKAEKNILKTEAIVSLKLISERTILNEKDIQWAKTRIKQIREF